MSKYEIDDPGAELMSIYTRGLETVGAYILNRDMASIKTQAQASIGRLQYLIKWIEKQEKKNENLRRT